jgi:hypothetical protein
VGPSEHHTKSHKNQGCIHKPCRRPRQRRCLLKGCDRFYHPKHPLQRYCSEACRDETKRWGQYKAQHTYRATANGKEKRKEQSCRRRQRQREAASATAANGAWVIPIIFFRPLLRPARMLRTFSQNPSFSAAAFLFARVPAGL